MSEFFNEILGGRGSSGGGGGIVSKPTFNDFPQTGSQSLLYLAEDTNELYSWSNNSQSYEPVVADIPAGSVSNSNLQAGTENSVKGTVGGIIIDITVEQLKSLYGINSEVQYFQPNQNGQTVFTLQYNAQFTNKTEFEVNGLGATYGVDFNINPSNTKEILYLRNDERNLRVEDIIKITYFK